MGGEQISCCQGFGVGEGLTTTEQHERKFGGRRTVKQPKCYGAYMTVCTCYNSWNHTPKKGFYGM